MDGIISLEGDYKLDDIDIFNNVGVRLKSPDNHIVIQQLSPYDWFYIYIPIMTGFYNYFNDILPEIDLLSDIKHEKKIENFKDRFIIALNHEKFRREYIKYFIRVNVLKGPYKKALKSISRMYVLSEMFLLTYLFNTEGLKKKLISQVSQVYKVRNSQSDNTSTNARPTDGSPRIVEKISLTEKQKQLLNRSRTPIYNQ